MTTSAARWLPAALLVLAACNGAGHREDAGPLGGPGDSDGTPARPELPWTERFARPAVLLAQDIRVEGPPGLLDHVALRQGQRLTAGSGGVPGSAADTTRYSLETTPDGLLQVVEVLPGAPPLVEIRGQLDGWTLVALRRLIVLERPGEVPVRVSATGQAWWSPGASTDGSPGASPDPSGAAGQPEEQRGERLVFVGERPE